MKEENKVKVETPKGVEERLEALEREVLALKNRLAQEEQASNHLRSRVDQLEQRLNKNRLR